MQLNASLKAVFLNWSFILSKCYLYHQESLHRIPCSFSDTFMLTFRLDKCQN